MANQLSTLSSLTSELVENAGAFDVSDFGRLRVSGEDAIDLLDRLSTNDLRLLEVGAGIGTVLTTNKGRIIDLLRILRRDDDLIVGLDDHLSHRTANDESIVFRSKFGEITAHELIVPVSEETLLFGLQARSRSELSRLRVEQGVPAYPNEMNEDRNPLESLLKPHISFNKGCYIGQEVVARLNTYDRVQRFLCQLTLDSGVRVDAGAPILVDGNQVGEVTTSAPGLALAYLRKRFYEDGLKVEVHSRDEVVDATVRDIRPVERND